MAQRTQAPPSAERRPPTPRPTESGKRRFLRDLGYRLFEPVDGASLAFFRMLFGALMIWEVYRYFSNDWIQRYWVEPSFHFTYHGFGWVEPLPGPWMEALFAVLGGLAACIALGLFYRVATVLFFVGFTYTFLLEQARYLNHFYLVCLLAFLLCFVPANRVWSLDALLRKRRWPETVPTWSLWLLRAQIGLVFFFAGVAKLNGDWLRGEPLRMWLAERPDFPLIGGFFDEPLAPWLFSYGGLLFDLLVIPLLIWPRTRPFAFLAAVGFHMTNQQLFSIGIFPFLALGTALLFFPPDWPRFRWLRAGLRRPPRQPVVAGWPRAPRGWRLRPAQMAILGVGGAFLAIQVLMPLRHFVIPGNVSWTEEGHRWSWHMKLRDKDAATRFAVVDANGALATVDPSAYLTQWQYEEMSTRPDMIVQFARHVREDYARRGLGEVAVRGEIFASLNGREFQRLLDPEVDLASIARQGPLGHADWIVPLHTPLKE
jgi:HTTM domain/Vitamin K-dependent gamma-carboxylase, lumenal domain